MAALSNKINFVFNQGGYNDNEYNHNSNVYEENGMYAEDNGHDEQYIDHEEEKELLRKDYLQECELDYTPNIVRWMKSNYLQHIKGEKHTVLVGGYDHTRNYLQTFTYGKTKDGRAIQVNADHTLSLDAEIADIQFANELN